MIIMIIIVTIIMIMIMVMIDNVNGDEGDDDLLFNIIAA